MKKLMVRVVYPNGLTASWAYDANDQLLQVCNAFPTNIISQYDYTYDVAGRRITCAKSGSAFAQNDTLSYGYNEKSELTNAVAAVDANYRYAYEFDDIGNRESSSERGTNSVYAANNLNQYTSISNSAASQMLAHPSGSATPNLPSEAELLRCISSLRENLFPNSTMICARAKGVGLSEGAKRLSREVVARGRATKLSSKQQLESGKLLTMAKTARPSGSVSPLTPSLPTPNSNYPLFTFTFDLHLATSPPCLSDLTHLIVQFLLLNILPA